jgi:hypothetical protein
MDSHILQALTCHILGQSSEICQPGSEKVTGTKTGNLRKSRLSFRSQLVRCFVAGFTKIRANVSCWFLVLCVALWFGSAVVIGQLWLVRIDQHATANLERLGCPTKSIQILKVFLNCLIDLGQMIRVICQRGKDLAQGQARMIDQQLLRAPRGTSRSVSGSRVDICWALKLLQSRQASQRLRFKLGLRS